MSRKSSVASAAFIRLVACCGIYDESGLDRDGVGPRGTGGVCWSPREEGASLLISNFPSMICILSAAAEICSIGFDIGAGV